MSGPPTNLPVTIMSAGLPVALSLSDDNKSIVGMVPPHVFPPLLRMTWIVLPSDDDGTFTIKSAANKQSIGFEGDLAQEAANLVTGNPSISKNWVVRGEPDSEYYTISLPDSPFVIGMPRTGPGAQAQLLWRTGEPTQLWSFQPAGF